MDIKKIVYMRKTCRHFESGRLDDSIIEKVRNAPIKPLYPEIKIEWDIVDRKDVKYKKSTYPKIDALCSIL